MEILNTELAGNRLMDWAQGVLAFIGLWLVFILLRSIVQRQILIKSEQPNLSMNEVVLTQLSKLGLPVYLPFSLIAASRFFKPIPELHTWLFYALMAGIAFRVVRFGQALIHFSLDHALSGAEGERRSELIMLRNLSWLISALLWLLAIIFVLSNAGINVSSALAGLGIGGVAVALAAQKILGDLIASVGLLLDKPFRIGDLIGVNDAMGTVERIGMKTTRIRSVNGEELILPNSTLTSSKISNFSRAMKRRVCLQLSLAASSSAEQRRSLVSWIAEALASVPRVELEVVQFSNFGESTLNYDVNYFVPANDSDYKINAQHEANLAIAERLDREGVVLAAPTRTLNFSKQTAEILKG
jgi:small-conductance mechanosensitive channel